MAAALAAAEAAEAGAAPTLIWASQPTLAGQTMQLWGGGLLDTPHATVDGAAVAGDLGDDFVCVPNLGSSAAPHTLVRHAA